MSEEKKKFEDQKDAAKKALQEKAASLYEEMKKKAELESSQILEKAHSDAEKIKADSLDREKEAQVRLQQAEKREAAVQSLIEEARKSGLQVVKIKDDEAQAQLQRELEKLRGELADNEAKSKAEMEHSARNGAGCTGEAGCSRTPDDRKAQRLRLMQCRCAKIR